MEKETPLAQFAATTLRLRLRETRDAARCWRYWGYDGRKDWTHNGNCRQLLGTELSDRNSLAPQSGHVSNPCS